MVFQGKKGRLHFWFPYKNAQAVSDQHEVREFRGLRPLKEELCSGGRSPGRRSCPPFLTHGPPLALGGVPCAPGRMCGFRLNLMACLMFSPPRTRKEMWLGSWHQVRPHAPRALVFLLRRRDAIWARRSPDRRVSDKPAGASQSRPCGRRRASSFQQRPCSAEKKRRLCGLFTGTSGRKGGKE